MKNRLGNTRAVRRVSGPTARSITTAVTMAYLLAGTLTAGGLGRHASLSSALDRQLRRRITDRRDRGALSLEQAIVTAVLSAAAIALGVVIVNAILAHQSQIR